MTEDRRVLVVEDDTVIAMGLKFNLEDMGWAVVGPAGNEANALALIENEEIGVALLDVNLGRNLTSFGIATELAEKNIPFIFISGYDRKILPAELADRPFLPKPLRVDDLVVELEKLLAA